MIQSSKDVEQNVLFLFILKFIYPIIVKFYNIKIIGKENLINDKSVIYISKHTTHNYDLIPGLFTLYNSLKKPVRGLGHFFIYFFCPHYTKLGVVIGDKYTAEKLIENNESIAIIPGGVEEMLSCTTDPLKLNWVSKSGKYKTGFARLAIKYDIDIVPVAAKNVEYMVFSPMLYLINKFNIKYTNSKNTHITLFYIKAFFITLFSSILVIPIPMPLTFVIGSPIKIKQNENEIEYAKRCELGLQTLIYDVNAY